MLVECSHTCYLQQLPKENRVSENGEVAKDESQPICFVVMGFGEKTAYTKDHKPRILDLDATYESIIEPAVTGAGLRCIRADQMLNSGMIDSRMYELLLRADLVVADISTGNVNAVYELGVRHALRPHSTIIMQEDQASFHFDLSHISTFTYTHLGSDIGSREAADKKEKLEQLIRAIMATPTRDSPVYEYLKGLGEPSMSEQDYESLLTVIEEQGDRLQQLITQAKTAKKAGKMKLAAEKFGQAIKLLEANSNDAETDVGQSEADFIMQQHALTTYKSEMPNKLDALKSGLAIIEKLRPESSHDTETLGIAGAIRKRLWSLEGERSDLDKAIQYYGRGFDVKQDYYNGENYTLCLEMRAAVQEDEDEANYDRMTARKTRKRIVETLAEDFKADNLSDRKDLLWMHATMANSLFALARDGEAEEHEKAFRDLAGNNEWMLETYENGKNEVLKSRV